MASTILTGAAGPVTIAPSYTISAPGLVGTVTEMTRQVSISSSDSGLYEDKLDAAMRGADIKNITAFELGVTSVNLTAVSTTTRGPAPVATPAGEPAMELQGPVLQPGTARAVLYTDEAGVTRWVFPTVTKGASVTFLLPLESAKRPATTTVAKSAILTTLGRRLIKVLEWASDPFLGPTVLQSVKEWEMKRRPYRFRRLPFGDQPLSWEALQKGPALLLIHGTFSTAEAGFSGLSGETLSALIAQYDGRVFAFDHPSLYHSPRENVQTLLDMLPNGADLQLDIVTHSRGGLVGRELTERLPSYQLHGRRLRIRRAIFVAAPQRGTILTDSDHGIMMLDRYTNLFTDLPDDAFTISMESLFTLAKLLYHNACTVLPGLLSMFPPGDYLRELNAHPNHHTEYFAIAAEYKPTGASALTRFGWNVADALVDGIFAEANDGVVPTLGAYQLNSGVSGFPIDAVHRLVLGKESDTHHCNYFTKQPVREAMLRWLHEDQVVAT